jgi:uncharacterized protein
MNNQSQPISRFAPQRAFPPYAFTPGLSAHPTHDPEGHSYNRLEEDIEAPDPARWAIDERYLFGIDLFNYGYYWEAHEIWEDLWNADGRIGLPSDFFKALIKLAAAGVKVREGVARGAQAHASGAAALFEAVRKSVGEENDRYMGLSLRELIDFSRSLVWRIKDMTLRENTMQIVFDFILNPMV